MIILSDEMEALSVQIPGEKDLEFKIGGQVHDALLPPSRLEHIIYAYASLNSAWPKTLG